MITGIIMASGFSKRMGKDKLLLDINGETLIERVIKAVKESNIEEIIMTYKNYDIKAIGDKYNLNTVYNSNAEEGQSSSIKVGIKAAKPNTDGYVFFVADQPFLSSEVINKIINEFYKNTSMIVVPLYKDKKGNPVIFPFQFKKELLMLEGDIGGRKIIMNNLNRVKYIKIDNFSAGQDIDTWDEYINLHERNKYDGI